MGGRRIWRPARLWLGSSSIGGVHGRPTRQTHVLAEPLGGAATAGEKPAVPKLSDSVWRQLNTLHFNSPLLPRRVVDDPRVKAALPHLGQAAYVVLSSGFIMTDIIWLRMLLTGGYSGLVCYHALQPRPLRIPLIGSLFFAVANAYMGAKALQQKYLLGDCMTTEETVIYEEHFASAMSALDFKRLMEHCEVMTVAEGEAAHMLVESGSVSDLILILEGSAEVYIDKETKALVHKAGLIGEVSFLKGGPAASTVRAKPGCRYLRWDRERLTSAMGKRPSLQNGLELKIGRELTKKLASGTWKAEHLLKEIGSGGCGTLCTVV
mmetsp:Transcript_31143/g.72515  ORF Transcript_31143/g.72515 Transcript_31143/m.72515 type:complete len:322 (+) Transcript_31143:118-1083(+)